MTAPAPRCQPSTECTCQPQPLKLAHEPGCPLHSSPGSAGLREKIARIIHPVGFDEDSMELISVVEAHRKEALAKADKIIAILPVGAAQPRPDPASEAMRNAIRGLCIELEGVWDAFEYGLRAEISNTNYVLIRDKIEEARRTLSIPSTDREGGK